MAIISERNEKSTERSLRERIVFLFAALLFAVLAVINIYPHLVLKRQIIRTAQTETLRTASSLSAAVGSLSDMSAGNIGSAVQVLRISSENRRIIVTDRGGVILFDSLRTEGMTGKIATYSELLSALSGKDTFYCLFENGSFSKWAAVPVLHDGHTVGAVYLYEKDTENAELLANLGVNIRLLSAVIAVLAAVFIAVFTFNLGKRFNALLKGVRAAGDGDFSYRIDIKGSDELNKIADEFNTLNEKIQDNEKARQQFVSDASHELKTPLASIKLLSDSIINSENIERTKINEFLGDISSEVDRLTKISESLISINRADSSDEELYECDLVKTVRKALDRLSLNAEAAQVTLSADIPDECLVRATADGLYHIVQNLVENAIKYNKKGGKVDISVVKVEKYAVLTVSDTGIGIPEHEQEHIFERFFRVDKMRSRATGGTGLGLAIAKEWVEKFGGRITVKSVFGKGTSFTVTLRESGEKL